MLVEGSIVLPEPKGGVLLIQLGDIGDVVLTMPAIRTLRRHFPDNELTVCVREHARELAEDCPWTDGVISVDKQRRGLRRGLAYHARFLKTLRNPRFSLAIDLRTGSRGAIAAFLSGAPYRIGRFAEEGPWWRNNLFTHLVRPVNEAIQYAPEHNLNILAPFGLSTGDPFPALHIPEKRKKRARVVFREAGIPDRRPIAAIHPFSLWQYKEWQPREWISLMRHLTGTRGFSVIVTGSSAEQARAEALTKAFRGRAFNLAGKTSIGELPAILRTCSLFVGVDTAALHMACAVNVPTIGIFGPSSPLSWAPRGERHCVATKGMWCQPCRQKGCQGTEKSRCLDDLKAEEVISVVETHLERILREPQR
ncbi:MAG: glycosyltransferase family 9 protein [Deltaproteobacteria bacterium]|nr:glycosyltransferase family 9 protein [Deltaproteobacteria bacterium]